MSGVETLGISLDGTFLGCTWRPPDAQVRCQHRSVSCLASSALQLSGRQIPLENCWGLAQQTQPLAECSVVPYNPGFISSSCSAT